MFQIINSLFREKLFSIGNTVKVTLGQAYEAAMERYNLFLFKHSNT